MSEDWFVHTQEILDLDVLVAAAGAVLPNLAIRSDSSTEWVVLVGSDDRPRVWISPSRPNLGEEYAYRSEIAATAGSQVAPFRTIERMVRELAESLARTSGGEAVRLSASTAPKDDKDNREEQRPAAPRGPDHVRDDCPLDTTNEEVAILVQTRPVVTLLGMLYSAARWAAPHRRRLVVVTPAASVLTQNAANVVRGCGGQWVADAGDHLYDGFTGEQLVWDGTKFSGVGAHVPATEFLPDPDDGWVISVTAETTHPFDSNTTMGTFAQDMTGAMRLAPLQLAGLEEPLGYAFDVDLLTGVAQELSPGPCRLAASGPQSDAVLWMTPQPLGLIESFDMVADATPPDGATDWGAIAQAMLAAGAQVCKVQYERSAAARLNAARSRGLRMPALVVWAKSRFPTLSDAEALSLGGPNARLVTHPVPAVIVTFDQGEADDVKAFAEAFAKFATVLSGLNRHDEHRRLAAQAEQGD